MTRRYRDDNAHDRRKRRNKVYSLDRDDGIEKEIYFVELSPYEVYERKVTYEQLYVAINKLPPIQMRRIYARYFMDMKNTEIARAEGVDEKAVRLSIELAKANIREHLEKFFE